jgi:hypothetical protein
MIQTLMEGGPDTTCKSTLKKYKAYSVDYKKNKDKQSEEIFYQFADRKQQLLQPKGWLPYD